MFEPRGKEPPAGTPPATPARRSRVREAHLLDRLSALYRHRRLLLSVFPVVVTLFMLQSYSTVPLYQARAKLLLEDKRTTEVPGVDNNMSRFYVDQEPYYQTQYRILVNRVVGQRTVRRLQAEHVTEIGVEAEGFGPMDALRSVRGALVSGARLAASTVIDLMPLSEEPEPAAGEVLEALDAPGTSAEESEQIARLIGGIDVQPVTNTTLVDVVFVSPDPVFAAAALNIHLDEYVQFNLDSRLEETQNTLAWIDEELVKQVEIVDRSERALSEYRERQNAVSLDDDQNIVTARLTQLNDAVTRAEANRLQQEAKYNQVRDLDPEREDAATFPAVGQYPAVKAVTERLTEYRTEAVRLSGRYGERHPSLIKLNASIANAEEQLRVEIGRAIESTRNEYRSALEEERGLTAQLEQQKLAVQDLGRKEVGYAALEREAASNRRVYEALLQQQKQLQVTANSRANNVKVMESAQIPGAPFTPNTRRDWFVAMLLGVMCSLGLVAIIEYLDDTIKTPDDVERKLGVALLGLLPRVSGLQVPVAAGSAPREFEEALRTLRTSLTFVNAGPGTKVLAVTSTEPREGKTTFASHLVMLLALGNQKVLIIDADMRRPSMHKTLGLNNSVGLSHVLAGQTRLRDAVTRTGTPNLFAMTAGHPPPNPAELLSSQRMHSLLTGVKSGMFDWVIIDTLPVLAVTDPVIIAPLVSGVVFVVGTEVTRAAHAARAIEMLEAGNPDVIVGAVLNRVDFDRNRYYYSRHYGYRYASYYGESRPVVAA